MGIHFFCFSVNQSTDAVQEKSNIHTILKTVWGYDSFRPGQEDIIHSILNKKDTLALLPTGGGKSICYQVPGLAMDGVCIVVSPLIALMYDQVQNLKNKKVEAVAITSDLSYREIDVILDNTVFGKYKFLYVSPERLKTEVFKMRLNRMKVSFIAVDEAHCISQWGYDFRPSYLEIAEIRKLVPTASILALTATATPEVAKDIQDRLLFSKNNVFKSSFLRENLGFIFQHAEQKEDKLLRIVKRIEGSGVLYANTRKKTKEWSDFLKRHGIKSAHYHAGLNQETRKVLQADWINNKIRVICATNAFGMGIDKSDVRFVVHVDIPESIEAYYQEAGRAGRDQEQAYAVLLWNDEDLLTLEDRLKMSFPEQEAIKRIYDLLGNYFQLAVGSGEGQTFPISLHSVADRYRLKVTDIYHSIRFLEKENLLQFHDSSFTPARFKFEVGNKELYQYKVKNEKFERLIDLLLRSYPGCLHEFMVLHEERIARNLKTETQELRKKLNYLQSLNIIAYESQNESPKLTFISERIDSKSILFSPKNYRFLYNRAVKRVNAVKKLVVENDFCRSQMMLDYFGEESPLCGTCDVCKKNTKRDDYLSTIKYKVSDYLKQVNEDVSSYKLLENFSEYSSSLVVDALNQLLDEGNVTKIDIDVFRTSGNK